MGSLDETIDPIHIDPIQLPILEKNKRMEIEVSEVGGDVEL